MHKAANNNNLVLIDSSSNEPFADSKKAVGKGVARLYELLSEFAKSRQTVENLADRLITLAVHAHYWRDLDTVQEASRLLMNLPLTSARQVGLYYLALTMKGQGRKDEARSILNAVAEYAPLVYRARAIQTLGLIHYEQGQSDEAMRHFLETEKAVSGNYSDLLTSLVTHLSILLIKSDMGDHRGALSYIQSLWPLVRVAAKQYPLYYFLYHNALAVEFCELNRIEEAEAACAVALASPFAPVYPNWSATRDEITAKRASATPSVIAVSRAAEAVSPLSRPRREIKPSLRLTLTYLFSFQTSVSVTAAVAMITRVVATSVILQRTLKCAKPRGPPTRR